MPEHRPTGDLRQASYSGMRAALVSVRQKVEAYQFHTLVSQLQTPVWRRGMTKSILSGEIDAALNGDLVQSNGLPRRCLGKT